MTLAAPEILTLRAPDLDNLDGQSDEQTGRRHLSQTSLSMALNCLRKFGWAYDERLELVAAPKPLALGKAFHHGIEHGDADEAADLLERPTVDQSDYDALLIDQAIVRACTGLYLDRWGDTRAQREVGYRIRLRSPYTGSYSRTFDLMGRADGVIDHGDYLELIEDKLKGAIDVQSVRRVKLDRQVALEAYALWRVTGKPVRVIRYRFIRKPSIKPKQNESTEQFIARLGEDYLARPEFYSHEEQTYRSDDDLLIIEQELWDWAEQLRQAQRRRFYARNTDSCGDFGGCQFAPLCLGDPDARSLYRVKPENPDD